MATSSSYTIRSICGKSRYGVFKTVSGREIETPSCIVPADHGAIPHLTGALADPIVCDQGQYIPYYTAMESFMTMIIKTGQRSVDEDAIVEFSNRFPDGLASCLHSTSTIAKSISIYGLRAINGCQGLSNSRLWTSAVKSNQTVYKVTPQDYAKTAVVFKPDVLITMMDLQPQSQHRFDPKSGDVPETFSRRQCRRNLGYLSEILKVIPGEALSVFGMVNEDVIKAHNDDLAGYVVPLTADNNGKTTAEMVDLIPQDKARLALGVRSFQELVNCVRDGIDLFESSWVADLTGKRMALCLGESGSDRFVNMSKSRFIHDLSPIDADCCCLACGEGRHSRAYIHHLITVNDLLAHVLLMSHNLHQINSFFTGVRKAIESDQLPSYLDKFSDCRSC